MVLNLIALILVVVGIAAPFIISNALAGWIGIILVIVGVVLGFIARKKGPRSPLAMISIILGLAYLVVQIVALVFVSGAVASQMLLK